MIPHEALETARSAILHFLLSSQKSFPITLALSLLCTLLVYITLAFLLRPIFRRLENTLALGILGVSQNPLIIITGLVGVKFAFDKLQTTPIINWTKRGLTAAIVVTLTYLISQLFTQVVTYYLRAYVKQTEAVWDDVLVPILERLLPILTYLLGTFLFLETLGIDLTGIWVAFGGLTFVLGFGLRDILANFFSGLVLLIDTPFQFGDVISMTDSSSMAVIKNIGLRVSKLYLVDSDCEVYIPNASLVNKDIINLTRPTTHFATTIEVNVKRDTDLVQATEILRQSVLSHPDILGNIADKLKYIDDCQSLKPAENSISKQETGKLRLLAEQKVNEKLQKIEHNFEFLTKTIKMVETGGLSDEQIKAIQRYYQEITEYIGLDTENNPETLIALIREWYEAWLKDPNLHSEDRPILMDEWETKLTLLETKITKLSQKIASPTAYETRLDDNIINLVQWLRIEFKASTDFWREPTIRLGNFDSDSNKFTIKFYIDNIKLENCQRGNRVANEVRREMVRRLMEAKIYQREG